MPRRLLTVSAFVCLIGAIVFLAPKSSQVALPPPSPNRASDPSTPSAFYALFPFSASWASWWHPSRRSSSISGTIEKGWNLLYHLGGNGPWIEKVDGVVPGGVGPPEGCRVEQVHMMSRHGERYPTVNAGGRMLRLLRRIKDSNIKFKGDLAFVNDWDFFTEEPEEHLEQLTTTGPYAGTLEAFTTGVKLRTRYEHLLAQSSGKKTTFWASDCKRVIQTARYFGLGFFGLDSEATASLKVIPETDDLGADTLTPGDTCLKYGDDLRQGHDLGAAMLAAFQATYLGAISDRLAKDNPEMVFGDGEIYSMQEMCGFETIVTGASPWCAVFTHADWENFEYARDVVHFYRAGPGNPYGPTMGWLWLNATTNLLATGPAAGSIFFSFVHDGDIVPMISALDLFPSPNGNPLPVTHVDRSRAWRTSQVTPMGGRVIFERLSCARPSPSSSYSTNHAQPDSPSTSNELFVRINVNDGIVALPACNSGPGRSCPLERFTQIVRSRGGDLDNFKILCGLSPEAPDHITFLHQ